MTLLAACGDHVGWPFAVLFVGIAWAIAWSFRG